jgi:hypothetical protein
MQKEYRFLSLIKSQLQGLALTAAWSLHTSWVHIILQWISHSRRLSLEKRNVARFSVIWKNGIVPHAGEELEQDSKSVTSPLMLSWWMEAGTRRQLACETTLSKVCCDSIVDRPSNLYEQERKVNQVRNNIQLLCDPSNMVRTNKIFFGDRTFLGSKFQYASTQLALIDAFGIFFLFCRLSFMTWATHERLQRSVAVVQEERRRTPRRNMKNTQACDGCIAFLSCRL